MILLVWFIELGLDFELLVLLEVWFGFEMNCIVVVEFDILGIIDVVVECCCLEKELVGV